MKDSAPSLRSSAKKVETDSSIHGEGKIDTWFRYVFIRQSKCKGKRRLRMRCIVSNTREKVFKSGPSKVCGLWKQ